MFRKSLSSRLLSSLAAALTACAVALVPSTASADPGAVLGSRPTTHTDGDLSSATAAKAQTFSYESTLQNGAPTTVTGTLFEPTQAWAGEGDRPTIVFAPGTRGQDDQCAPSRAVGQVGNAALGPAGQLTTNINYEYPFFKAATDLGIRVVVTDYVGLGTPGHHSYVNNIEEAHAVLDAARAGLQLAGAPADAPVGLAGYSQGGGAAAAAAEWANDYAPELNIKGTYAGAPPADLVKVMAAVDGTSIVHVLGYAINGFASRNAEFRERVLSNLNPWGIQFLRSASGACIPDSMATWAFVQTRWLTKDGASLSEMVQRDPVIREVLEEQKLGSRPLNAPMLVANAPDDDIIPFDQARTMAGDYCALGGEVYFEAANPTRFVPGPGINHAFPLLGSVPSGLDYLIERFNDVPAPNNCA